MGTGNSRNMVCLFILRTMIDVEKLIRGELLHLRINIPCFLVG